eukprot:TRINITY_DN102151_c0_g1_i1.p1 TRINITY_DN102151_c0_g1~~TRINITY_DN102151_c0_g1_i1.p1  ORF type:complete len:293 (+),score=59.69 TRINITY_DN102151_c0_g1_i1:31-909(+)
MSGRPRASLFARAPAALILLCLYACFAAFSIVRQQSFVFSRTPRGTLHSYSGASGTSFGIGNARALARAHVALHAEPVKLTYFSLWAKGPSIALALEHSGMDWEGEFPDWKDMKAKTPFRELPVLEILGLGMIGHELAILNYIGQGSAEMGGANTKEFLISQQLMNQAEDIYQKLSKIKTGLITGEAADSVWTDENMDTHNRNYGIQVLLQLLEEFYGSCGSTGGQFTASGKTVGECKLFATLHALVLIKKDVLSGYPGLSSFYDRFAAEKATQAILTTGGKMPGVFDQYFK